MKPKPLKTNQTKLKTKPENKQPEKHVNQSKISSMLKPKPDETMEKVENQKKLTLTMKPPTLVYRGKQIPSETTVEEAANQHLPSKPVASECETKPIHEHEKPPTETKPEPNHENTQTLKYKTKPEAKTETNAVTKPKPKPSQRKGTKPKLAETNDLKLFLARKAREREMKLKGKIFVDYHSTPPPSPSNDSVSATLSPNDIPLTQSATRADRLDYRDATELSLSIENGDRPSSAN